jgi:hypothetical protein
MSRNEDIIKLVGLTIVAIVSLAIILGILLFAYGIVTGSPNGVRSDVQVQDGLNRALTDYQYKLDLVKEQTQRIDMYYAAKTSTSMSQIEFSSWLGTIRGLTQEFILRENNAINSGNEYLDYLPRDSDEYNRIINNEATSKEDIKKVLDTYNGNVYIYNQQYGTTYGDIAYLQ